MSDTFHLTQGDRARSIRYALLPADTVLTGASVAFRMKDRAGVVKASGAAAIITPTGTPTVQYDWQAADVDTVGNFEACFVVTYSNGKTDTFPSPGWIPVRIQPNIS